MNSLDTKKEIKKFSLLKRAQSFKHAVRGIALFVKTTHNAWIQICVMICAIALGIYFGISRLDWVALILVIGLVFITEAINTAIEIDIDLTSPTYHPYARDTKDVAAGAVLIASIISVIVSLLVFIPYVKACLSGLYY